MNGDHSHVLNQPQFFHTSDTVFRPGDVMTREGAWRAKQESYGHDPELVGRMAATHKRYTGEEPREDHLYYADSSFQDGGESSMYGGHTYAVQPETSNGRKINKHAADPHYKDFGGGAFRTKGQLRVLHEVNHRGEKI